MGLLLARPTGFQFASRIRPITFPTICSLLLGVPLLQTVVGPVFLRHNRPFLDDLLQVCTNHNRPYHLPQPELHPFVGTNLKRQICFCEGIVP